MFRNMTISKKLTLLLMSACAAAVLFACFIFYIMATDHFRKSYEDDLNNLSRIIGYNCEAALAFRVHYEAERVLASLSERPSVVYAVIRDDQGSRFASYGKPPRGLSGDDRKSPSPVAKESDGHLVISQDIVVGGKTIGILTLYDDMRGIVRTERLALFMILVAVLVSMGVTAVIGSMLQGIISGPILSLAGSAERITREQDFSLRAEKHGNDEVGQLVNAFNSMLDQIEKSNFELQSSEKRFRTLVDQAVDAFFLFEPDGRIIDVNQRTCENLGYSREELLAISFRDIDAGPISGISGATPWGNLQLHIPVTNEGLHRRKDGMTFPVEMRLGLMQIGDATFIMGLARDISERLKAETEKEKLEIELLQAQKMEAIGHLAGGVAHDFNNLLTPIIGYADMMLFDLSPDDPHGSKVRGILKSAMKAKELTLKLLSFGRKQMMQMNVHDLNEVIISFDEILRRIVREDISLDYRLASRQPSIFADRSQIELLLLNLVINAQDAITGEGRITIETGHVILDDEYVHQHPGVVPGEYCLLSVADNGSGMPREVLDHIFEPFFTTKPVGKGTGLGLATAYGIIKQHEGHVSVLSELGAGTCFRIYFPVSQNVVQDSSSELTDYDTGGGSGIILLAEDNEMVRSMCQELLESRGYQVFSAATPNEAIALVKQIGSPVDLLLTDVVMPEMNGKELYERLAGNQKNLKVLYISGYTNNLIVKSSVIEEGCYFLQKPFTMQSLLRRVKELIRSDASTRTS